jgi:hypothetical protein
MRTILAAAISTQDAAPWWHPQGNGQIAKSHFTRLRTAQPMADLDRPLVQQIFDIPERQWKPNVHHHGEADDLR